jgi:hypothetical protein
MSGAVVSFPYAVYDMCKNNSNFKKEATTINTLIFWVIQVRSLLCIYQRFGELDVAVILENVETVKFLSNVDIHIPELMVS